MLRFASFALLISILGISSIACDKKKTSSNDSAQKKEQKEDNLVPIPKDAPVKMDAAKDADPEQR